MGGAEQDEASKTLLTSEPLVKQPVGSNFCTCRSRRAADRWLVVRGVSRPPPSAGCGADEGAAIWVGQLMAVVVRPVRLCGGSIMLQNRDGAYQTHTFDS